MFLISVRYILILNSFCQIVFGRLLSQVLFIVQRTIIVENLIIINLNS